jgi:transketolase
VETQVAWTAALERADGPSSLLLSRQVVPYLAHEAAGDRTAADIRRGAYVFAEAPGGARRARAVLIATGSEVPLAFEARKRLAAEGVAVRVVSMPSTTVFDRQGEAWKSAVLPPGVPRVAVEAGVTDFWWKYVRADGAVLGVDRFGESAPAGAVYGQFGLTVDNLAAVVRAIIRKRR